MVVCQWVGWLVRIWCSTESGRALGVDKKHMRGILVEIVLLLLHDFLPNLSNLGILITFWGWHSGGAIRCWRRCNLDENEAAKGVAGEGQQALRSQSSDLASGLSNPILVNRLPPSGMCRPQLTRNPSPEPRTDAGYTRPAQQPACSLPSGPGRFSSAAAQPPAANVNSPAANDSSDSILRRTDFRCSRRPSQVRVVGLGSKKPAGHFYTAR